MKKNDGGSLLLWVVLGTVIYFLLYKSIIYAMRASTSRIHTDIHSSESSILPMLLNDIRLENFLSFSPPFFFLRLIPAGSA